MKGRIIKFRGKSKVSGSWVYGDLITKPIHHECVILENGCINHDIIPESVGQFAGFKDKNGKDVYEGDITTAWSAGSKANFQVKWRQHGIPCFILFPAWQNKEFWNIAVTEYKKGKQFIGVDGAITTSKEDAWYDDGLEVIGNIYENPELTYQGENPERSVAPDAK